MPSKETPSYSSSRVQRATRINSIEAARLQQRLQYIEQAKLHQCRLTNQDIRLISMSIDYIQASSGHSAEAWRPEVQKPQEEVVPVEEDGPCFLYGERIWSRKKRRMQRPMSAVERSGRNQDSDSVITESASISSQRSRSSPIKGRPMTATGYFRSHYSFDTDLDVSGISEVDGEVDKLSSRISTPRTPRDRVTPHQDWEDDTSEITKRILQTQARAQSGKSRSLYQSPEDAMNEKSSKNVRGLIRKIRISATPISPEFDGGQASQPITPFDMDHSPRRPVEGGSGLGRRATLGEILNQRRPTLSAGAWRSHLNQTLATPMSISQHRQQVLSARKELNDTRTAIVNEKVKDFIKNSPRTKRAKSALR